MAQIGVAFNPILASQRLCRWVLIVTTDAPSSISLVAIRITWDRIAD